MPESRRHGEKYVFTIARFCLIALAIRVFDRQNALSETSETASKEVLHAESAS